MQADESSTTLRRFFSGLTEQTFQVQLGVVDPPLVDYLSGLLIRSVRTDQLLRVRNLSGKPVSEVGEMMVEADARIGDARREVHRHIGDFTLFWAGLYPEALRRPRRGADMDRFSDYCSQGSRAYLIASTIEVEAEEPPSTVLERLGQQFEMCAYGLREVRREWERRDADGEAPRPFLID